ncbi:MAG: histidinol-phosphatase [Clostridia bacterium]|nr:histidinol-phosphatase [Clostridia bacterium]
MIFRDFHCHTIFCDGTNTPEEMVISAIEKGMTDIGFSVHSYMEIDKDNSLKKEDTDNYFAVMSSLKSKYKGKINIYAGVEQDYYSEEKDNRFDYVIGSVHFLNDGEKLWPIDLSAHVLSQAVEESFGGDWYLMAEHYFGVMADVVKKTNADIIGHFDLITKFNETANLFDAANERYINAAKKCVDALIPYGKPFEINTGAISRGYRSAPYPSLEIIEYIKAKGGKLILSSDAHSKENLMYQFDKWEHIL